MRKARAEEIAELEKHRTGLRTIAVFEAVKGLLVLAAGAGVLALIGKDVPDIAEHLIKFIHLNPEGHTSHIFLRAADRVTDAKLWAIAGGALAYSIVRGLEAWGLWHAREWAEWFALLSGGLYLPWEIYEVLVRPNKLHWLVFVGNVCVVLYIAYLRFRPGITTAS